MELNNKQIIIRKIHILNMKHKIVTKQLSINQNQNLTLHSNAQSDTNRIQCLTNIPFSLYNQTIQNQNENYTIIQSFSPMSNSERKKDYQLDETVKFMRNR